MQADRKEMGVRKEPDIQASKLSSCSIFLAPVSIISFLFHKPHFFSGGTVLVYSLAPNESVHPTHPQRIILHFLKSYCLHFQHSII